MIFYDRIAATNKYWKGKIYEIAVDQMFDIVKGGALNHAKADYE